VENYFCKDLSTSSTRQRQTRLIYVEIITRHNWRSFFESQCILLFLELSVVKRFRLKCTWENRISVAWNRSIAQIENYRSVFVAREEGRKCWSTRTKSEKAAGKSGGISWNFFFATEFAYVGQVACLWSICRELLPRTCFCNSFDTLPALSRHIFNLKICSCYDIFT